MVRQVNEDSGLRRARTCSSSPTGWAGTRAARWPAPPRSPACAACARRATARDPTGHRTVARVAEAGERLRALVRRPPGARGHGHHADPAHAQRRDGRDRPGRRLARLPAARRRARAGDPRPDVRAVAHRPGPDQRRGGQDATRSATCCCRRWTVASRSSPRS